MRSSDSPCKNWCRNRPRFRSFAVAMGPSDDDADGEAIGEISAIFAGVASEKKKKKDKKKKKEKKQKKQKKNKA